MDFTIYHAHPVTREYIGTGMADTDPLDHDNLLIPAHAYSDASPEADAGFAVIRNGDKWELVKDLRGSIYSTASGTEFECAELGELPEGYTHLPCPGPDYAWTGTDWALDEAQQRERLSLAEREWRNVQFESLKWLPSGNAMSRACSAKPRCRASNSANYWITCRRCATGPSRSNSPCSSADRSRRPGSLIKPNKAPH